MGNALTGKSIMDLWNAKRDGTLQDYVLEGCALVYFVSDLMQGYITLDDPTEVHYMLRHRDSGKVICRYKNKSYPTNQKLQDHGSYETADGFLSCLNSQSFTFCYDYINFVTGQRISTVPKNVHMPKSN